MSFTQTFGGTTVYPSDVSYLPLALTANATLEWPLNASTTENIVARIIGITSTAAYSITMPPADETGVGQTILFNNTSAYTITVKDSAGGTIASLATGQLWQIYLAANATAAGTWVAYQLSATVSQAQASALAGYGILAIGSMLSQSAPVTSINATYTLADTSRAGVYNWTGAIGTINLTSAVTVANNWFALVRNSGTGNLTIDPAGSETINGASTLVMTPEDSAFIVSDGTNFITVGLGQNATFAFDFTAISLAGLSGDYTLGGSEVNRISYTFSGGLAGDVEVIVPSTTQQYWVTNSTTGAAYTVGFKVSGQSPAISVARNASAILKCNGTAVSRAETASLSTPVAVADGGTGSTTAGGARVNLGGTATGIAVFIAANATAGRVALSAAASGANSDITSLTGLTTPLTVAQGGTGIATLTGLAKGNGTGAFTAAVSGTDYTAPGSANTFTAKQTFSGTSSNVAMVVNNIVETATVTAAAPSATTNFDVATQSVQYYTSNAANNWTLNLRLSSGTSLDTGLSTGQSVTVALITTQGATPYYASTINVDGTAVGVTTKWLGGAISAGIASSLNIYTFTAIKTGSATWTVLASMVSYS